MTKSLLIVFIAGISTCLATAASNSPEQENEACLSGSTFNENQSQKNTNRLYASSQSSEERCTHKITTYANGVNIRRVEYSYDDDGNTIQEVNSKWSSESNNWINSYKYDYEYNSNGQNVLQIYSNWSTETNDWVNAYKIENDYNENGLLTSSITCDWNVSGQDWIVSMKQKYEYDGNGNRTLEEEYLFFKELGKFLGVNKVEKSYDNSGAVVTSIRYAWSAETDEWIPEYKSESSRENDIYRVSKGYIWAGNEWTIDLSVKISYDSNNNQNFEERCYWDNGQIVSGSRLSWTYDSMNREIEYLYQIYEKYNVNNPWRNLEKRESEYLSGTFRKTFYVSLSSGSSFIDWIEDSKSEGRLDSNGRILDETIYSVSDYENLEPLEYKISGKNEYEYDSYGNMILKTYYTAEEGILIPYSKYEYSFDDNGRQTLDSNYLWSAEKGIWIGKAKTESMYAYDGERIMGSQYSWSDETDDWKGDSKFEYIYDGAQLRYQRYYVWSSDTNEWEVNTQYEYTFNSDGTPHQDLIYSLKDGELQLSTVTTYYYGGDSGIKEIGTDTLSIAINGRTLEFNTEGYREIYSVEGRLISKGEIQSMELPARGIYLIRTEFHTYKIFVK